MKSEREQIEELNRMIKRLPKNGKSNIKAILIDELIVRTNDELFTLGKDQTKMIATYFETT